MRGSGSACAPYTIGYRTIPTNGRSVKAASLSIADLQAGQSNPGCGDLSRPLARNCPSAFFPSLAASAMLSKKTGERSSGADKFQTRRTTKGSPSASVPKTDTPASPEGSGSWCWLDRRRPSPLRCATSRDGGGGRSWQNGCAPARRVRVGDVACGFVRS